MVMIQQLNDDQILEIKQTLMTHRVGLKSLYFKYNSNTHDMFVEGKGIEGIPQNEEYYDNLEDNLIFSDISWLTPICGELKANFQAEIDVLPDGTMDHSKVKMEITIACPLRNMSKKDIMREYYSVFKRLLKFRGFIKKVEFRGHEYSLKTISFSLELDGRKVNTILKNTQTINTQVLSQWQATLDHVLDYNKGRFKFVSVLPVVNGRMSTATFESAVCFKFSTGVAK
ncbi:hypothetical protein AWM68_17420 [Fictibacillus phosphorivorans]|uniref:Uncharacterized protein n=1 Tax=Fictibacillus phosphorivorans TaxID=1221500 RepID=A0A163S1E8_9BACL|nr:hypothetical protein [Fictibacillus phosphorivorans]KZE67952.1 hypothetical protein AWM68_17420 [Fictibacillus phosphorivorans]